MHFEIIDCYFNIFFVETKLEKCFLGIRVWVPNRYGLNMSLMSVPPLYKGGFELLVLPFRRSKHLTFSQHLIKAMLYSLFNSQLIYGCQLWEQYQGTEFKKNGKITRESYQNITFLLNNAPIFKEMYKLKILKPKHFYHFSKHTFYKKLP